MKATRKSAVANTNKANANGVIVGNAVRVAALKTADVSVKVAKVTGSFGQGFWSGLMGK